jgi:hypothetical protein
MSIMDKDAIIKGIADAGWKKATKTEYLGYKFDFVGEKYSILSLANWHILVRFEDNLSKNNGKRLDIEFKDILGKSKGFVSPKHFFYCIVANSVNDEVPKEIESYSSSGFKVGGAMGAVYLVDLSKSKVYGHIPPLPVAFKRNSENIVRIFKQAMGVSK